MAKRKSITDKYSSQGGESSFELDLAPMLAMMVALIPVLLSSIVFVKVKIIETPLPQVISESIQESSKGEQQVEVNLQLGENKNLKVMLQVNKQKKMFEVKNLNGEFDKENLLDQLISIKNSYPHVFKISLYPHENVPYDQIIKVIDLVRKVEKKRGVSFKYLNKKTGKQEETDLLFPEINFGDVVEA